MSKKTVKSLIVVLIALATTTALAQAARVGSLKKHAERSPVVKKDIGPEKIAGDQVPPTASTSREKRDDENIAIQKRLATFTEWLVIVGFIQSGILVATILAILHQAKVAKNSERGWVLVNNTASPETWYSPDHPEYLPGMVFEFKAYGGTPCTIVKASFRLRPVRSRQGINPPAPDLPATPDYGDTKPTGLPEGGRVLPPHGTFTIRLSLDPPTLTEDEWCDLRDGGTVMCAYGFVEYFDAFERKKITKICYTYNFAWGGILESPDGARLNPPGFEIGGPPAYNKTT